MNVSNEIGVEGGHVKIQCGFLGGHLRITHPALALVALVAIGGNPEQVGELGPSNEILNLI